jgi:plasmid maintenance system antidote protein VapI
MRNDQIKQEDALELINQLVKRKGTQAAAAEELGVSPAHISDIIRGNRGISDEIAQRLGYRRVVVFEKVKE